MSDKQDLIDSLQDVSDELRPFLETTIPWIPSVDWPTTTTEAILANGRCMANINKILKEFEGLPLVELRLRTGQLNNPLIALLMTKLAYLQEASLRIIEPKHNGKYAGHFSDWIIDAPGYDSVEITTEDRENYSGGTYPCETPQPGTFTLQESIPIGKQKAVVRGMKANGDVFERGVTFQVISFEALEIRGTTPPAGSGGDYTLEIDYTCSNPEEFEGGEIEIKDASTSEVIGTVVLEAIELSGAIVAVVATASATCIIDATLSVAEGGALLFNYILDVFWE